MRRGDWFVRRAWAQRHRDLLKGQLAELEGSRTLYLGQALVELLQRPWRLPLLPVQVVKAWRTPPPPSTAPPHVDPGLPPPPGTEERDVPSLALRDEVYQLLSQVQKIKRSRAFGVGQALARLRRQPGPGLWQLVTALWRPPHPHPVPVQAPGPAPQPARRPERPTTWTCLAPPWLEKMWAHEGVVPDRPDHPPHRGVLVCLEPQAGPTGDLGARLDEVRRRGGRVVAWQLGEPVEPRSDLVGRVDRLYSPHREQLHELRQRWAVPVGWLPPAIQPRIHNPIGWWNRPEPPTAPELPPVWRQLVQLSRGTALSRKEEAVVERALKSPLPTHPGPSWAEPDDRTAWQRFVRLRWVLDRHGLGRRLEQIERDLELGPPRAPARVSMVLCTKRPECILPAIAQLARQTYPHLELVVLLHGEGFPAGEVEEALDGFPHPSRLLVAPARLTLGECMQMATEQCTGAYLAKIDDDDWYAPRYLEGQVLLLEASQAAAMTRISAVFSFPLRQRLGIRLPGNELIYRPFAAGSFMVIRRCVFDDLSWRPLPRGIDLALSHDCVVRSMPLLSGDRFNAVNVRHEAGHTTSPSGSRKLLEMMHWLPAAARLKDFSV